MSERARFIVLYSSCMALGLTLALVAGFKLVGSPLPFAATALALGGFAGFLRRRHKRTSPESIQSLPYILGTHLRRWWNR
jgi:hypothetical protein